ncbi:hypothetical protein [Alteromonas sp. 009811495]|uniref:hypothetical protein n=1 Tax=Alteromonas sp. 009811495 TaxID=3002962 RepID=UPI00237E346C|nr:hypothetical protein [Alteromonas sp. 009811495]WDT87460.1 hypothetical protein OZ660_06835 [Alteromonas sp. 009811495]
MSAVQLLEKLGASAELQKDKKLSSAILDELNNENEQMWCLLFPAEDDKPEEGEKEEEQETDSNISLH